MSISWNIPNAWNWSNVGELYTLIGGGTPSTKESDYWNGKIPWITSADISDNMEITIRKTITEKGIKNSATNIVPKNTLLVVTRVGLGKVALTKQALCFNQDIQALIENHGLIEPKFALLYLNQAVQQFKFTGRGTTISGVTKNNLRILGFPVAPFNEQVRIVARVEELFSRLDAGVRSLQAIQVWLEQYRQATLQQAYTGKLTQKWRKNNEHILIKKRLEVIDLRLDESDDGKKLNSYFDMPEKWILIRLGKLIKLSSGKFLPKKEMVLSGKFPVYGGNGLTGYHNKYLYEKEMIIIGRVGVYCGNIHISIPQSWITDNALVVESKNINLRYLAFALEMCNLNQYASSTAQPVISQKTILSIPIPIPSSEEQEKIIEKVERINENYIHLKNEINNNIKNIVSLKQSILKKAYTGGLVPQNPNDEPASVLLERIKTQKKKQTRLM